MANTVYSIDEIRFNVEDEDLTDVYVLIRCADMPLMSGWRRKQFIGLVSTAALHAKLFSSDELNPLYWDKTPPPDTKIEGGERKLLSTLQVTLQLLKQVQRADPHNPMILMAVGGIEDAIRDATP